MFTQTRAFFFMLDLSFLNKGNSDLPGHVSVDMH
jgi:hypothetical protein